MSGAKRAVSSYRRELIIKSQEAAISAISTFNSPEIRFKSETYIVLMIIAWTYAFHALYKGKVDIRQRRKDNPRLLNRTKRGAVTKWSLDDCLDCYLNPLTSEATKNLKLLIGIRHEIEHQMTTSIDNYLSPHFQSCAMNYNNFIKVHLGQKHGLDSHISFSIQFSELTPKQFKSLSESGMPEHLKAYILDFESELTADELNSPNYSYSMIFTKTLQNKAGEMTNVIEFVDPASELAKDIDKTRWVLKDREKPKYLPKKIISIFQEAGYPLFSMTQHTRLWKEVDGKVPSKGFGIQVESTWYWYDKWKDFCIKYCSEHPEQYRAE